MFVRGITAAVLMTAASFISAQAQVVDRQIPPAGAKSPAVAAAPSGNASAELYYQLQVLQQEVQTLRGMVEEQAFEIKRLKQQRLDDYLDLDRRLSQLSAGATANTGAATSAASDTQGAGAVLEGGVAQADEMKHYRNAMNMVLKEQNYDGAVVALNEHLQRYPSGRFAANAQYWLGEVYLQKQDLPKAKEWFSKVLSEHPQHTKVADAQYKLGIVYHKSGDAVTAKNLLEKVAASNASVARLARDYLNAHFAK